MNDPLAVAFSVRLYRGMLRFYPRTFRSEYGEAMIQIFRDLCLQQGEAGLAGVWGRTIFDYAVSLVSEHMNRGVEMTKSKWIQLSGWGLAASGFLLMLGFAASSRSAYDPYNAAAWPIDPILNAVATPFIAAALLLMSGGLAGLLARFQEQAGGLARAGLVLGIISGIAGMVGAAGLSFFENGPWWDLLMIGLLGVNLGLALFGIDCLRQRLFSRWNGLPLAIGASSLAFALAMMGLIQVEWPGVLVFVVFLAFALGLARIGYQLISEIKDRSTVQPV